MSLQALIWGHTHLRLCPHNKTDVQMLVYIGRNTWLPCVSFPVVLTKALKGEAHSSRLVCQVGSQGDRDSSLATPESNELMHVCSCLACVLLSLPPSPLSLFLLPFLLHLSLSSPISFYLVLSPTHECCHSYLGWTFPLHFNPVKVISHRQAHRLT